MKQFVTAAMMTLISFSVFAKKNVCEETEQVKLARSLELSGKVIMDIVDTDQPEKHNFQNFDFHKVIGVNLSDINDAFKDIGLERISNVFLDDDSDDVPVYATIARNLKTCELVSVNFFELENEDNKAKQVSDKLVNFSENSMTYKSFDKKFKTKQLVTITRK